MDLLEHAVQPLLPLIHQKGLVVLKEIDPSTPTTLVGDAARIRQILINLVGNAAKFTDRGRITLRVRYAAANGNRGRLYFEVEDTGIGIPKNKQSLVFEAFQQVDDTTTRRYGGAGLGLAICVELVRRLGGSISLKSTEGAGSIFSFDVGVRRADDSHDATEITTLSDHTLRFTTSAKVLAVAEDNPVNRRVLVGMLEEIGHAPIAVEDGRSLITLLRSPDGEAIDGVLLDLQMPELGGVDVTKAIRDAEAAAGGGRLPIIAVTAHAMKGDRERCLEAGMDDYLVKPVEPNKLFEVLEAISPRRPAIESAGFRRQIGGRKELGRELTTMFATELPQLTSAALEAIEHRDSARLIDVAHRLAGSLANFHATTARDLARRLELAAREGDWEAVRRTLPVLRLWIDRSLAELHALLAVEVGAA
jgi:CheY-like chemotaxis protein